MKSVNLETINMQIGGLTQAQKGTEREVREIKSDLKGLQKEVQNLSLAVQSNSKDSAHIRESVDKMASILTNEIENKINPVLEDYKEKKYKATGLMTAVVLLSTASGAISSTFAKPLMAALNNLFK